MFQHREPTSPGHVAVDAATRAGATDPGMAVHDLVLLAAATEWLSADSTRHPDLRLGRVRESQVWAWQGYARAARRLVDAAAEQFVARQHHM